MSARKHSDNLTIEGANRLARIIKNYWAWRGLTVNTTVEPVSGIGEFVYAVRSDMVNGQPPQ